MRNYIKYIIDTIKIKEKLYKIKGICVTSKAATIRRLAGDFKIYFLFVNTK